MNAMLLTCLLLVGVQGSLAFTLLDPGCVARSATNPHILGGTNANLLANPWMALILQEGQPICGGSLITPIFILTAGHCKSERRLTVRLGEYDTASTGFQCSGNVCIPAATEIAVELMIVHPFFRDFHYHDIALFRLAQSVVFSAHIRPICVVLSPDKSKLHELLDSIATFNVTGWGKTETSTTSRILQTATLRHLSRGHCYWHFDRDIGWPHICAGRLWSATCNGDSGGPLSAEITVSGLRRPVLLGMVSYGKTNCRGASVFTNVLSYLDWITDTVQRYTPKEV